MARVALRHGAHVGGRFGLCVLGDEGAAVAGGALACESGVVHVGWRPGGVAAGVAGIALSAIRNMSDGLGQCVGVSIGTIVASRALAGESGMVHCCGSEGSEIVMAAIALRTGRDMQGGLSNGGGAVMAGGTFAGSGGVMHKSGGGPVSGGFVADVALCRGADVPG